MKILIKQGLVVDGNNTEPFIGDVLINDDYQSPLIYINP